jgi:hypothetical protein
MNFAKDASTEPNAQDREPHLAEIAWLAIRQPAMVRFVERSLARYDHDTLAAGLDVLSFLTTELTGYRSQTAPRVTSARLVELSGPRKLGTKYQTSPSMGDNELGEINRAVQCHLRELAVVLRPNEEAAVVRLADTIARALIDANAQGAISTLD